MKIVNFMVFVFLCLVFFSTSTAVFAEDVGVVEGEFSADKISVSRMVLVTRFIFSGNQVISDDVLQNIAAEYKDRSITLDELQQLRLKLSQYYLSKGYINSGVIIKDQTMVNGELHLQVVEGRISRVDIHGLERIKASYITDYLRNFSQLDGVLDVNLLKSGVAYLNKDPRISELRAHLKPSKELGLARLELQVEEADPWKMRVDLNNYGSPILGEWRAVFQLGHLNVLGYSDHLGLTYTLSEGLGNYGLFYQIPVNDQRTLLELELSSADSVVVLDDFKSLDIRSHLQTQKISLRHPVWLTAQNELFLTLGLETRENQISLLGSPFSTSSAASKGRSNSRVILFSQSWRRYQSIRMMALESTFKVITDGVSGDAVSNHFSAWLGQIVWREQWSFLKGYTLTRGSVHLSDTELPITYKFPIGGRNSVRGYSENRYSIDNAARVSLEWHSPVFDLGAENNALKTEQNKYSLTAFVDHAQGWDRAGGAGLQSHRSLTGLGVGFSGKFNKRYQFEVYVAVPVEKDSIVNGDSLQESGIHMQISTMVF